MKPLVGAVVIENIGGGGSSLVPARGVVNTHPLSRQCSAGAW
jgi:hypothetical protein